MNGLKQRLRIKSVVKILIAIIITLSGIILSRYGMETVRNIGQALIVTGFVSIVTEVSFGNYWNYKEEQDKIIVHNTDITFMQSPRIGFIEYYKWLVDICPSDVLLAGRSVLHRIEKDIQERKLGNVEDIILRRMEEGANIQILFLDPTWDLIDNIAYREGRKKPEELYSDLKKSLKIVERIYNKIKCVPNLKGSIDIKLYSELSQYAFHSVKNHCDYYNEENFETYIGYYLLDSLGWKSGVYKINTDRTRKTFEQHFSFLSSNSKQLLYRPKNSGCELTSFNQKLYSDAIAQIDSKL